MSIPNFTTELFRAIGVGVALFDAKNETLIYCNPAFAKLFPEAVSGVVLTSLVEELDHMAVARALKGETLEIAVKVKRRRVTLQIDVRNASHLEQPVWVVECQNISRLRETEAMIDSYASMTERRTRELEREKVQVEKLLLNVMPRSVYEEYKSFGTVTPRLFEPVSVLMLDFVGFTEMAVASDPTETVSELNDLFTAFDRIAELHGCERIKTIGDCYMAVSGLPHSNPDHARLAARCASGFLRYLSHRNKTHRHRWQARIGIASGSVVGSVVGTQKYVYDVFGPAVNCAARLQSQSAPMEITVLEKSAESFGDEFRLGNRRVENLPGFGECAITSLEAPDAGMVSVA